jgi:hypothetical protein
MTEKVILLAEINIYPKTIACRLHGMVHAKPALADRNQNINNDMEARASKKNPAVSEEI